MTADLPDFLLARITEDEEAARAAAGLTDGRWSKPDEWTFRAASAGMNPRQVEHLVRHDPARVLAECDVKRRIVERLTRAADVTRSGSYAVRDDALESLSDLAVPYADHADYQPEWVNEPGAGRTPLPQGAGRRSPQHCPECGAGETEVHARSCTSKAGRPLSSGAVPYGGACGMSGCRYADRNVRHIHPPGDINR